MEKISLLNILNESGAVTVVHNEKIEGNPLVTPMKSKETGNVRLDRLGKPMGSIMLRQTTRDSNDGFLNTRNRVAFITAPIVELEILIKANNIVHGTALTGKIIILESLQPFWKGQQHKINPAQNSAPIGVMIGEQLFPVYMRFKYVEDMSQQDSFIRTAEDAIRWKERMDKIQSLTATSGAAEVALVPGANAIPVNMEIEDEED